MNRRIILYAPSINSGGAAVLLRTLLRELNSSDHGFITLDSRLESHVKVPEGIKVRRVISLLSRFQAELFLSKHIVKDDVVICFGNLPPLFRLPAKVVLFLQSRHLLDVASLREFRVKKRAWIMLQRFWFKLFLGHVNKFIVQTPSMARDIEKLTGRNKDIEIAPFIDGSIYYSRKASKRILRNKIDYDFVYVSSGESHKNHRTLVEAWQMLAEQGFYPSLCITLDQRCKWQLVNWIEEMIKKFDLRITNVGAVSYDNVLALYQRSGALIFPSKSESLGLPLIEAQRIGLPVLASELDFVRDILDPEQSFNPTSAISICRAVRRHLGYHEEPLTLLDGAGFWDHVVV